MSTTRSLDLLRPDGTLFASLVDVLPLEGPPVSGFVTNGGWWWRRHEGTEYAYDREGTTVRPVHEWPAKDYTISNDVLFDKEEDTDAPY